MMNLSQSAPKLFNISHRSLINSRRRFFRGSKYKSYANFFATVSRMEVLLGDLRHYN